MKIHIYDDSITIDDLDGNPHNKYELADILQIASNGCFNKTEMLFYIYHHNKEDCLNCKKNCCHFSE